MKNNNEDAFRICFLELFGGIDLGADPRHAHVSLRDLKSRGNQGTELIGRRGYKGLLLKWELLLPGI